MKKAEQYLKQLFEEPFNLEEGGIEYDFLQVVKQIQIDTIKATVQACADNADIKNEYFSTGDYSGYSKTVVNKFSIMKVADKLIKELYE